jgi:hypothetical protein
MIEGNLNAIDGYRQEASFQKQVCYLRTAFSTFPETSVNRKSRPE